MSNTNSPATDGGENPYISPAAPTAIPEFTPETQDEVHATLIRQVRELEEKGKQGASWFYWVAALSVVNSVISLFGGGIHFLVGLGVTAIVDAIADAVVKDHQEITMVVKGIAFCIALIIASIVGLFGWLSNRRILPVFAIGMALYLLDGLLFLFLGEIKSVLFHAFALWSMGTGFVAYRNLNKMLKQEGM